MSGAVIDINYDKNKSIPTTNLVKDIVFSDGRIIVSCGDNKCIELKSVQLEGKKRMDVSAFLNGNKIEKGTVLGK